MTKLLLVLHVVAAIIAVGPVTVAASMFPAATRRAASAPDRPEAVATLRVLHRICRVYAVLGLAVPVFGFATAGELHVLGSPWVIASITLTGAAALVLALLVLPTQERLLTELVEPDAIPATAVPAKVTRARTARLAMLTGSFNLLWATVTVLMILRPGSTTGV
ncbi:membrane protein [Streptacidiphilus melanogenes]|uniref:membrane protein n=1 Tax=Streptacidiphilus melanogenes TaxID=411235 RepID=UPI0005AA4411|nr:membrane protein [Streptacidiphilus melanogenes]